MTISPLCAVLLLLGCALSSAAPTAWPEILPYEPIADKAAVVHSSDGMARFTVLSSRLLRMEYTDTAHKFEDRATTAIVNRAITPVPAFTYTEAASGALQITTNDVVLTYIVGEKFTPDTLSVSSTDAEHSAFKTWSYGEPDTGNLLGTIKVRGGAGTARARARVCVRVRVGVCVGVCVCIMYVSRMPCKPW